MKKIILSTFLLLFVFVVSAQSPGCDINAIRAALTGAGYYELTVPNQPCSMYFVNPTSQSNVLSEQAAQQFGAHMVSFQTAQENADVLTGLYNSPYTPANYTIWIGFSDAAQEGNFVWLDGAPVNYTNWGSGEPNDLRPNCCNIPIIGCVPPDIRCSQGEDCVQMYGSGQWNDFGCDVSSISVIEINLCPVMTTTPDSTICSGTGITLSTSTILGSTPYTYTWNPGGASGSTYPVSPTTPTSYTVRVTDRWGCFAEDTVVVTPQNCNGGPAGCDINAVRSAFTAAGYNELGGVQGQPCSMYFINPTSQNANLSEQAAQQLGAHLVVFNDAAENQAVVAALNAAGVISSVDAVWVGYSDQTTEGTWIALDGTQMSFLNWASNEPNNNGQGASCCSFPDWLGGCQSSEAWRCQYGEDCAQIYSSGQWNDLPCNRNSVSVVEVNLCPVMTANNDTTICTGNSVSLSATAILGSNPYTYNWVPGGGTTNPYVVSPATNTTYVGQVTDRWGCYTTDTVNVTVQGGGTQSFTVSPNPVCANSPVTVTYTGTSAANANYTWNFNGGTVSTGSGQGPYLVSWATAGNKNITLDVSGNGCTFPQVSQPLTVNANPVANAGADATICSGGSVPLGAAPVNGYTYSWNPSTGLTAANIANPAFSGPNTTGSAVTIPFVLTVTQNNCTNADTVLVTINPAATATISAGGPVTFCNGGSVVLASDSAFSAYNWSNNANTPTITVTQAGNYSATLTDANGCQYSSNTIAVTLHPDPVVTLSSSTNEACAGALNGSITVSASQGSPNYTYNWSTTPAQTTATAQGLAAGNYTVTVTDANTCTTTGSFTVSLAPAITLSAGNITQPVCNGGTDGAIDVTVSNGTPNYSFVWNDGQTTNPATGLAAGNYSVTLTDGNTCTASGTFTVTEPTAITITLQAITEPECFGGSDGSIAVTTAGGTAGYTYLWSNAQTTNPATGLTAGNYDVTVTDAQNCTATSAFTVTEPNEVGLTAVTVNPPTCYGFTNGLITVSAVGGSTPYSYVWNTGNSGGTLTNAPAGTYTVTATDANNCSNDTAFILPQPDEITLQSLVVDPVPFGSEVTLNTTVQPGAGNYTYTWSPANQLSCTDCANPQFYAVHSINYQVTVTDAVGCSATAEVNVSVKGDKPVFIPNVFTPNGDNQNDEFKIFATGVAYYRLLIFNRIGEKVFESNNNNEGWNGTHFGKPAEPGVYTYIATVSFLDGESRNYKGGVTLLK